MMKPVSAFVSVFLLATAAPCMLGGAGWAHAQPQPVSVALPDTSAPVGRVLTIPVRLERRVSEADGVVAFQFDVQFDPSVLDVTGATNDGTLSDGWLLSATPFEGRLRVASANARPAVGGPGPLVLLTVEVVGEGTSALSLKRLMLNEGDPDADGADGSLTARPPEEPNRAPEAHDDTTRTPRDASVEIDVLENDVDPDGDALTVTGVTVTSSALRSGTAEIAANGRAVRYAPASDAGSLAPATFRYRIVDEHGAADTASVVVLPSRKAPLRLTNYPNPFARRTTIAYTLPREARVHLAVYDALGRRVSVLVNGQRQKAGFKEVLWDAQADAARPPASSGVYLCRLRADEAVRSTDLVLIR